MFQVHCLSEIGHFGQPPQRSCSPLLSRVLFDNADWINLRLRPKTSDKEGSFMVTHQSSREYPHGRQNGSLILNMNILVLL